MQILACPFSHDATVEKYFCHILMMMVVMMMMMIIIMINNTNHLIGHYSVLFYCVYLGLETIHLPPHFTPAPLVLPQL